MERSGDPSARAGSKVYAAGRPPARGGGDFKIPPFDTEREGSHNTPGQCPNLIGFEEIGPSSGRHRAGAGSKDPAPTGG
jgi:hypothetical protein